MKKKIEELTIRDIKKICLKHKNCVNCPLEKYEFLCLGLENMKEKTLKDEVLL